MSAATSMLAWRSKPRLDTIGLAKPDCVECHGLGAVLGRGMRMLPCKCVYRRIFRICLRKYHDIRCLDAKFSRAALEYSPRGGRRITWSRKNEEFVADFVLVARRSLTSVEWRVFESCFLWEQDYRHGLVHAQLSRGNYFHLVYRIEVKLGRIYRDLRPYGLFPLDEYFNGCTDVVSTRATADPLPVVMPLRLIPPLRPEQYQTKPRSANRQKPPAPMTSNRCLRCGKSYEGFRRSGYCGSSCMKAAVRQQIKAWRLTIQEGNACSH